MFTCVSNPPPPSAAPRPLHLTSSLASRAAQLITEFCNSGDLHVFLRKNGPRGLPSQMVLTLMVQLVRGLEFLWQRNLIHRDIKPHNLLLHILPGRSHATLLKIADFGFARELSSAAMAETVCGSPLYMAPEILKLRRYNSKADLWSVGAVDFIYRYSLCEFC